MNYFDSIFGNSEAKTLFSQRIKDNKLSHAYMLVGPSSCGKKTFAKAVAAQLALENNSEEELITKIENGHSPDVMTIPTDEKRIGIDTVRSFISTVYLTPNELNFKMYIFDAADRMTPQAQNALLKVIEEPPKNVYIFLLCENPSSILQTVRSRVISVNMQTFSEEEIKDYLLKSSTEFAFLENDEHLNFAIRTSRGALGAVKKMLEPENCEFEAYTKANEIIFSLSKKNRSVSYFDFLSLIFSFADTSEKLLLLLKYLTFYLRDILAAQNSDYLAVETIDEDTAVRYASILPSSSVISDLNTVTEITKNMAFNSNLGLACTYLAENLWRKT